MNVCDSLEEAADYIFESARTDMVIRPYRDLWVVIENKDIAQLEHLYGAALKDLLACRGVVIDMSCEKEELEAELNWTKNLLQEAYQKIKKYESEIETLTQSLSQSLSAEINASVITKFVKEVTNVNKVQSV